MVCGARRVGADPLQVSRRMGALVLDASACSLEAGNLRTLVFHRIFTHCSPPPSEAEPADRRRTSMSRARQTSRQPKPKSVSRSRPVIQTDAHLADNQPIHQRGDRSQTHPYTYVDAIFSAHSDGLMIILRGCPNVKQPLPPTSTSAAGSARRDARVRSISQSQSLAP